MRAISKGPEPLSLLAHRQTPPCDYNNYRAKDDLREALASEQRGLCCYCMGRITSDATTMKIEHWQSQTRYPEQQLTYVNLLGSCPGEEGQPRGLQHCDTRKGERDLRWNPADSAHHIETRIRYEFDGSIRSDDAEFDAQLNEVLNLNLPVLKNHRKGVRSAVVDWLKHQKAKLHGPVSQAQFERERDRHIAGHGRLIPYCQVAVWWLNQRLLRMR